MQNIVIRRYQGEGVIYGASIVPVDDSWILYVRTDDKPPELWVRKESTTQDGTTTIDYQPFGPADGPMP